MRTNGSMVNDLRMLKNVFIILMTCSARRQTNHMRLDQSSSFHISVSVCCLLFVVCCLLVLATVSTELSLFFFRLDKYNIFIHWKHLGSSSCFMIVDDAKWKRKSCQHASMMLDLWLISFGFACLFSMALFFFAHIQSSFHLVFSLSFVFETTKTSQHRCRSNSHSVLKLTIKPDKTITMKILYFYIDNDLREFHSEKQFHIKIEPIKEK